MRIGIITFHWATNYGAVIQAYALLDYIESLGHKVEVINYKPARYDWISFRTVLRKPSQLLPQLKLYQREQLIERFRRSYLKLTKRYNSSAELQSLANTFDVIISGSDQVLNPYFTRGGEGKPTDVYYLGFAGEKTKRIGYAISFGCRDYPKDALEYALKWINNFDSIGVRETSGLEILNSLKYRKYSAIVPDPTLLCGAKMFDRLHLPPRKASTMVCVYILGGMQISLKMPNDVFYIDENHKGLCMEQWLCSIRDARFLVTNSYHGMLMAILFHTPFAVIKKDSSSGQNDRLSTVLDRLGIKDRIIINDTNQIESLIEKKIDWATIDKKVDAFRLDGMLYIKSFTQI